MRKIQSERVIKKERERVTERERESWREKQREEIDRESEGERESAWLFLTVKDSKLVCERE